MTGRELIQMAVVLIGSFCFGTLFNFRGRKLLACALGSVLSWGLYLLLGHWIASQPLVYFMVSVIISIYAEAVARILKTPATPVVTTSLIPLIPGGSLYYTMAYAFENDFDRFLEKAVATLQIASALALGIILIAALSQLVFRRKGCSRKGK